MGNFNRNNDRGGFRPRDREVTMHRAVCSNCGQNCEVPFKPTGERPVYCSDCFRKSESSDSRRDGDFDSRPASNSGGDLRQINEKLDRILEILKKR